MNEFDQLEIEYKNHKVFEELSDFSEFYQSLSYSIMMFVSQGTRAFLNLDTYVFSSIKSTLDSIKMVLTNGSINDGYSLLRKYYDATIINIYTNIYLREHFSINNFIVERIDNWRKGTEKLPSFRIMSQYIKDSDELKPITELLSKDRFYKEIRERCNDHTHYNYYNNILLNDKTLYLPNRVNALDIFLNDLTAVFVQHFAYLFYLNNHYMMASDYTDSLDLGLEPEEESQYWVAPFIQVAFDRWIKTNRSDIAEEIKSKTDMHLE